MQQTNYKRAKGVFLVVCDGTCENCWLSQKGWDFETGEGRGFVDMNGHGPCDCLQLDEGVMVIKHRTDKEAVFDIGKEEQLKENYLCYRCGEHHPHLFCRSCVKEGIDTNPDEPENPRRAAARKAWETRRKNKEKEVVT